MTSYQSRSGWPALSALAKQTAPLTTLFAEDAKRGEGFSAAFGPLRLDYSRERVSKDVLKNLAAFAEEAGIAAARKKMFEGGPVNTSEKRPALHTALRRVEGSELNVGGVDVMQPVLHERARALAHAEKLRSGAMKGASGKAIRHIIHVGIGGSELGPRLLVDALADGKGPSVHFLASVDYKPLAALMNKLDAAETLVFIASKSFTTAEIVRNAQTLLAWLEKTLGKDAKKHLVAATAAPEAAKSFGVPPENIFLIWDWVGGRFSVWSCTSLSVMAAIGRKAFEEFLHGGAAMDRHFQSAPLLENIPVLLALLSFWNASALGLRARAVLPYSESLKLWPSYIQQLEMESLGKPGAPAPVVFGYSGPQAQHAFMQALHQGSDVIPAEILLLKNGEGPSAHQRLINANAIAQAEALAFGRDENFPGNRPSSLIIVERLSPEALGHLVAAFEHKVFVLGVMWNINPFDQWGVELGKQLAKPFESYLSGGAEPVPLPVALREIR